MTWRAASRAMSLFEDALGDFRLLGGQDALVQHPDALVQLSDLGLEVPLESLVLRLEPDDLLFQARRRLTTPPDVSSLVFELRGIARDLLLLLLAPQPHFLFLMLI